MVHYPPPPRKRRWLEQSPPPPPPEERVPYRQISVKAERRSQHPLGPRVQGAGCRVQGAILKCRDKELLYSCRTSTLSICPSIDGLSNRGAIGSLNGEERGERCYWFS